MKADSLKTSHGSVLFVTMSETEAIDTIKSLANQLSARNSNTGRMETFLDDGTDFTIAVNFTPDKGS